MKTAVVILTILVVAFVVAAGRHAPIAKVTPEDSPNWLKSLGARFKPSFDFDDVSRDCFDEKTTTFHIAGACMVRFTRRDEVKFRLLALQVKEGVAATIDFQPNPGDDSGLSYFQGRKFNKGEDAETLTIPAVGGSLTIVCMPVNTACSIHAD